MLKVNINGLDDKGQDQHIGTIAWDDVWFVLNPPNSPILREILVTPIVVPVMGKVRELTAKDKITFLASLRRQYNSAYLRASEPFEYRL
jgi:hypothetical protein